MPFNQPPVRSAATVVSGAALTLTLLSAAPSGAAVAGRELNLTFEGRDLRQSSGNAVLDVNEVTHNGGSVDAVPSWDGAGTAARFPAYRADTPPQAVLTAVDRQGVDDLDPGTAGFSFGADFSLDAQSWGSSTDNGNNLIQRGLSEEETQYKVQVDYAYPECRVKGRGGVVDVRSDRKVTAGTWYRADCSREGSTVTLTVTRLDDGTRWTYAKSGVTGSLTPASRSIPLSVGGKVSPKGVLLTRSADQFNGAVDNAFLAIS